MAEPLTIDELFTPATGEQWTETLLENAQTLQLPISSWQSGGVARTMLAIMANMFGQEDGTISIMAQGGFLDFAATGSVTYTAANGATVTQKVTPDPSVPSENPDGTLGWLDLLASSVYNVTRVQATYAAGTLAIANATSNTYGPYVAGTYHVTNPTSGAGYSNDASLTIAPANFVGGGVAGATNATPIVITTNSAHGLSGTETVKVEGVLGNTAANGFWSITVMSSTTFSLTGSVGSGAYTSGGTVNECTTATFEADNVGPSGTSATGTITETVTTLTGVTVSNMESFVGATWESNTALADRCRLKLQSLSPDGPRGSYAYFALTAATLLAEEDPPVTLSTPITRTKVQSSANEGTVILTVASASGAVGGVTNLAVNGASGSPILITTASAHGLSTGDFVTVSGVLGNTNANGTFTITVASGTTFTLDGTTTNAVYTSGGTVQGGDLGQVDRIVQANSVPDATTAFTQSATGQNITVVAAVEVPLAYTTAYAAAVQSALALYFASLPIGGIDGYIQYNDVIGVLFAAGSVNGAPSYVRRIPTLTLNGSTTNLAYSGPTYVAQLSPSPAITVTGV